MFDNAAIIVIFVEEFDQYSKMENRNGKIHTQL